MTNGEKRLAFIVIGLACVTILVILLFAALWRFKEVVGATLLVLIVAVVIVCLWGLVNEQRLRHARYKFKEEMPVGASSYPPQVQGVPLNSYYTPAAAQPNQYYQPSAYSGRQCEELKY